MKQDPKHILIIPSWYPSSYRTTSGIFFKEQAEILAQSIKMVGVVAPIHRPAKEISFTKNVSIAQKINNVITYSEEFRQFPFLEKVNSDRWFKICRKLFEKYIAENGLPDIVHVHSIISAGRFAKYVNEKYSIPFVITEHATGFALGEYPEDQLEKFREIVQYSSCNIAVSEHLADTLSQKIGGEWSVIPNTIQDVFFAEGRKNIENKENDGRKIFFSVSNLTPIKGISYLIDAFAELEKIEKDAELWIGGDGPLKRELQKQIDRLGLTNKVILLGSLNRNEVIEYYKKVNFYISPSLQETFGIVIIEALSFGLPTIATRCGGPEYILNIDSGIIVERRSSHALSEAMIKLIADRENYDTVKIIDYCQQNYSQDVVSEMIIKVYREVLNG